MPIARCLALAALTALALAGASGRASAEPQADKPDPKVEKADQLFAEGKALLESNLLQACGKFRESLSYNPAALGTLLNVALCNEKLGLFATAVARFTEARDRAKEQGLREHQRAAEDHLAALEASVPHLSIRLTEPLPDTKLLVDDTVVPPAARDSYPVDPGERTIVVSAPDRLPYRLRFVIGKGEHRTLVIPALARSVTITSSRYRIGQIITAAGGLATGTGIGIGLYARHQYHKALDRALDNQPPLCTRRSDGLLCDPVTKSALDNARNWGLGGTVVGAAGVAIAAAGVYLWITAPHGTTRESADRKLAIVPELTGDGLGVAALGRF
ncbi:MAG TPA: hypothetical protein VF469_26885 [Kofleriaceae bacterium]